MSGPSNRGTVLCVDDDESIRSMLAAALEIQGYEVLTASNGREALELMPSSRLDAVIVDYSMPEMTGGEAAGKLKRLRPGTPVIMFSGSVDIPASELVFVDRRVRKLEGIRKLLSVLQQIAPLSGPAMRRFPRYAVSIPFAACIERDGTPVKLGGMSVVLGEGGLGGKVEGILDIGEVVRIEIADSRLARLLQPQAEVRDRKGDLYGFAFSDAGVLTPAELQELCWHLKQGTSGEPEPPGLLP